jgi:hypothetical protein
MRRFDLLDEYTSIAMPKFSTARARPPVHGDIEGGRTRSNWRYGLAGVVAILLIALVAL